MVSRSFQGDLRGTVAQETWERNILSTAPSGEAYHVTVEERFANGRSTGKSVDDGSSARIPSPPRVEDLPPRLPKMGPALELGERLTQSTPTVGAGWGLLLAPPTHTRLVSDGEGAADGSELIAYYDPPGASQKGGVSVIQPYYVLLDGAGSRLILFDRHRSDLPFDGRHLTP